MSQTTSDVELCSTALLELGSRPINAFDDPSEQARLVSNMYAIVRDDMLRQHTWNFAKKRVTLAPNKEKPAFGYVYQFTLPPDFIRCLEVNGRYGFYGLPNDYAIEGSKLLANSDTINLRYIYRNDDVTSWDAAFTRLVICALKKSLAYPITHDATTRQDCEQEWGIQFKLAKTINGIEVPPQEVMGNSFIEARW